MKEVEHDENEKTYSSKKDIPDYLKPASYFPRFGWFQIELIPCASFVGNKSAWSLYHISEYERIHKMFPLRLEEPKLKKSELLLTKTELIQKGYSEDEIQTFSPAVERQNRITFKWYYLYKMKKSEVEAKRTDLK